MAELNAHGSGYPRFGSVLMVERNEVEREMQLIIGSTPHGPGSFVLRPCAEALTNAECGASLSSLNEVASALAGRRSAAEDEA